MKIVGTEKYCLIEEEQSVLLWAITFFWVAFLFLGLWRLQVASGFVIERHRTSQKVKRAMQEGQQLPLTEKVKFEAKLQRGNRVQVPKMVRWRFKLESYQILEVTLSPMGVWGIFPRNFLTRMSKDGRIVVPKKHWIY